MCDRFCFFYTGGASSRLQLSEINYKSNITLLIVSKNVFIQNYKCFH